MANVEFSCWSGGGFGKIYGDIHAVATPEGVQLTGTDDKLQQFLGMTDFVIVPDENGKVYLRDERGVGADVDRWTGRNVPNIGVSVITKK